MTVLNTPEQQAATQRAFDMLNRIRGGQGVSRFDAGGMGGGMGGGGGVRMDTARGMGGSFGIHGGANAGPMGGMGGFGGGVGFGGMGGGMGGMGIHGGANSGPMGGMSGMGGMGGGMGGGGGVAGIRAGEWDNVPQQPRQQLPQGGGIFEDPAPRRRRTGGGGGGVAGIRAGEWDNIPQQPQQQMPQSGGVVSAGGGGIPDGVPTLAPRRDRTGGGMGGGAMGSWFGSGQGGMMGGGMMGGGGGSAGQVAATGRVDPRGAYQKQDQADLRRQQTQQGARAGLGQPMQSRTDVVSGNQQGTVGGAFNNQPSAESDMSDSPDVGGGMGTARAGGGFNRTPPQSFGPTGGFSTSTRTQDIGGPSGGGGGTGGDGRPIGGGPIGGGPTGGGPIGQPSPRPTSPSPMPSPTSPTPPSYGGGFGMMSPYGGQQQPQINQDFSFSSNMYGQNPMMQMSQKQPKARQFAPRQGRSQSRTIGNLANLARQRRNLRYGWG